MAFSLSGRFRRNKPPLAGIDLSASSVKVVELSRGQRGLRVERYAIEPVERGAILEGNIEKPEAVAEALTRALRRCGSRAKEAALALPTGAVITKKIMLPAGLREEDYELQVETEASQYIPFPIDEVNLDFQMIGPCPNSEDDVDVLLAASRKEKVDDRVAVAEMAGLRPVIMDVEPYAVRAAVDHVTALLPDGGNGRIVAVFSIGQTTTSLTVVLNRQTIFEREQSFGGQLLTQELVRLYGLAPEEAEARKRSGDLPENYASELLGPFVEQGATDIGRALQFFFTSTPYTRVDQILLAGGSAVVPGFADAVAERTRVATELLNPFGGMELSASIRERQLRGDAPALLCATGLAMRRFDA